MSAPSALALAWGFVCAGWMARARPVDAARALALVPRASRSAIRAPHGLELPSPRRAVTVLLLAVALSFVFAPAGVALLIGVAVRPLLVRRRQARERSAAVEHDLSDVVALIGLAVGAGANLPGALDAAAAHGDGPLGDALAGAVRATRRGGRLSDALELLPAQLDETVRPLVAALVSCDRYGAPLGPTLDRLAVDVRTASRQRAEAAARRLPVRLLFPLVTCILPAFALLTVAPLIAGSFRGLGL
ncbi:MAG: tight adherence protein [Actinomycetota bacterium]